MNPPFLGDYADLKPRRRKRRHMSPEIPIPFEQENITPKHKDVSLSKLRKLRDRPLVQGEEYVRKNELVRTVSTQHYNGRRIPYVVCARQDVVKSYEPEPPNSWKLKYLVKLAGFKMVQLKHLIKRLMNRTDRLRKRLARPDHGFTPKQVQMLNVQFMAMAYQLEAAVAEAKERTHAHA